jgi:hypothetical protein
LTGKSGKEEDFEIHKKEDSVQKKRHYRNNNKDNDSSGSDSDAEHSRRVSLSALYLLAFEAPQYITKTAVLSSWFNDNKFVSVRSGVS